MVARETNSGAGTVTTAGTVLSSATGLNMGVDFASNAVTGTVSGTSDYTGTVTLNVAGTLSGTGMSGTLTDAGGGPAGLTITGGAFDGQFFGQNAAEVGGTMSATLSGAAITGDGTTEAAGFFYGNR